MVKQVRQRTGRTFTHVVLKVGQWEKIVKEGIVPFGDYEVEQTSKKLLSWRNKKIPVESNITTFYETAIADLQLTPDEAKEEAKGMALEALRKQIPEDAQMLSRNIEVIKISEADLVRIKVVVETLEDIGYIQKIDNVQ
jgi:similar to stage IV sporulation protein